MDSAKAPEQSSRSVAAGSTLQGGSASEQHTDGHRSDSYFAHQPAKQEVGSPTSVASGYKNSAELLRRLSLVDTGRPSIQDISPHQAHPALGLSGGIISASVCLPYSLGFRTGGEWEIAPRRGTSALFDSFAHLSSSHSSWSHTLVGWTGEIKHVQDSRYRPGSTSKGASSSSHLKDHSSTPQLLTPSYGAPEASKSKCFSSSQSSLVISQSERQKLDDLMLKSERGRVVPVWLFDQKQEGSDKITFSDQARWRRYAEHDLYTLFHYKVNDPTGVRAESERWEDYCRLNQKFADKIFEIYKPGDVVWIHDYHLLLLPSLLRQRLPDIYIGFFLHVPFPSSELLKCLSRRKEVLTGVLGSNMIGFQTYSYSRHFSSCCTRILGFDAETAGVDAYGAHIAIDVFPIGIDAAAVAKEAYGDERTLQKMQRIKAQYPDTKIIVGRDRLDTVRGVAQKLQAYELFLERYPEWIGKVILIQLTSPTSVEEEKEDAGHRIASKIWEQVSKINGLYGGLEYTPVVHLSQYIDRDEYFALLRSADVGLITSVRDGVNTTSLEYVLCQRENHGPLILSEFSGTAASLTKATQINPWNLGSVADTINEALTMAEEEKAIQHKALYKHITKNDIQGWTKNFLSRLLVNLASFNQSIATPVLDQTKLRNRYRQARRRLFMFDYDGTLTPIVKDPQAAIPSDRIVRTIKALARDPRNNVWVISGRDQAFLDEWLGHISELGLSAEHGSFVRPPGVEEWENLTEKFDMSWQREVLGVFNHYTERTQGSFIERKRIALTWHYRRSDPEYGAFQARACKKDLEATVATKWDVEVMSGKANLEVRPRFVNKGAIATRLINEYGTGADAAPDFVLCLGDDFTDEDMFRALRESSLPEDDVFAVTVGASSKQTLASWHLLEPADVIAAVSTLGGSASDSDAAARRN